MTVRTQPGLGAVHLMIAGASAVVVVALMILWLTMAAPRQGVPQRGIF